MGRPSNYLIPQSKTTSAFATPEGRGFPIGCLPAALPVNPAFGIVTKAQGTKHESVAPKGPALLFLEIEPHLPGSYIDRDVRAPFDRPAA